MPNPTNNRLGASLGKGFSGVNVEKYTTVVHAINFACPSAQNVPARLRMPNIVSL
jgi:hypothetical protein